MSKLSSNLKASLKKKKGEVLKKKQGWGKKVLDSIPKDLLS